MVPVSYIDSSVGNVSKDIDCFKFILLFRIFNFCMYSSRYLLVSSKNLSVVGEVVVALLSTMFVLLYGFNDAIAYLFLFKMFADMLLVCGSC